MDKKMIYIGKKTIVEMLEAIPLGKNEIGKMIGLTKGGFWHVTHKSGKMNSKTWEKFKKVYLKHNKKLPPLEEPAELVSLDDIDTDTLVKIIESRGHEVFLRKVEK